MTHFDIVFLDVTASKYYDRMVLERQALGGTEATIIRIAEGLASLGLKVAVVQSRVPFFEPTMGQHCFFMHSDALPELTCQNYIQIRDVSNSHLFPGSRKFVWLHDLAAGREESWVPILKDNKISVIAVSEWHRSNVSAKLPGYADISYIYNPVPEELYNQKSSTYDPNLLVWMSSPHKGLGKALELFGKIREKNNKAKLIVFNPGYLAVDTIKLSSIAGVSFYGSSSCKDLWNVVSKATCVFYPTNWDETFGCIAAEANALGVPLVTFKRAALAESVSSENQFCKDDEEIVKKTLGWLGGNRPTTEGKNEFKFGNIIMEWVFLLSSRGAAPKRLIE